MPPGNNSKVIYCPKCIMQNPSASGGQASLNMCLTDASQYFQKHWHPADADFWRVSRAVSEAAIPMPDAEPAAPAGTQAVAQAPLPPPPLPPSSSGGVAGGTTSVPPLPQVAWQVAPQPCQGWGYVDVWVGVA